MCRTPNSGGYDVDLKSSISYFIKKQNKRLLIKKGTIRIRNLKMLEINQNQFWKHFHHMFDGWNTFREMTCVNWYSIRINTKKFRIPLFPNSAIIRKELCGIGDMVLHLIWSKKSGTAKLCRSICLVMKIFWKISTDVVWPFKNRLCQNRSKKTAKFSQNPYR